MKKKNNKGYIGIDISISLLIIIILMPIIIAITNNINVANARISRKAQAISIATNVMECVKSILAEDDSDILVDDIYDSDMYAHGFTLTGITEDGKWLVSTWGKELMIDPQELSEGQYIEIFSFNYE